MSKGSYKNQCKFTSAQNPPTGFEIKTFILQYLATKSLNGKIFKLYLIVSVFQFAPCICHKSSHFYGTSSKMVENDHLYITRKENNGWSVLETCP